MGALLRLVLVGLCLSPIALAQDYAEWLQGEQRQAYELYQTAGGYGCHTCHGLDGTGFDMVGSDIRGKTLVDLEEAIQGLRGDGLMKALEGALDDQQKRQLMQLIATWDQFELIRLRVTDAGPEWLDQNMLDSDKAKWLSLQNLTFSPVDLDEISGIEGLGQLDVLENRLLILVD